MILRRNGILLLFYVRYDSFLIIASHIFCFLHMHAMVTGKHGIAFSVFGTPRAKTESSNQQSAGLGEMSIVNKIFGI